MAGTHHDQQLVTAGAPLEAAEAAVVMVHGRGATAQSIVRMAEEFHHHGVAYLAPQAARNTWYPQPFTAPVEYNEPGRTSGLQAIQDAIEVATRGGSAAGESGGDDSAAGDGDSTRGGDGKHGEAAGIPLESVIVLGFSQGACLASEFVARNPKRYGGLVALSGGLIGEAIDPEDDEGDLEGTPVFFGCSDVDPHIPAERVHASADVLDRLEGDVTTRLYEGMGHGVNQDEIDFVSGMVADVLE